jgi:hypothetical protein
MRSQGDDRRCPRDGSRQAPLFRPRVEPNERNGLRGTCRLMVDKITTVPKAKIGARTRSATTGRFTTMNVRFKMTTRGEAAKMHCGCFASGAAKRSSISRIRQTSDRVIFQTWKADGEREQPARAIRFRSSADQGSAEGGDAGAGRGFERIARELGVSRYIVKDYIAARGWTPYQQPRRKKALDGLEGWLRQRLRRHRAPAASAPLRSAACG